MTCQKWSELALQVKSVLKEYPKLRLSQGRKVRVLFTGLHMVKLKLHLLNKFLGVNLVCGLSV
jgi:hypothetical protein